MNNTRQSLFNPASLVDAREVMGLNASALANLIDVNRATIYNYEDGKTVPDSNVLRRLCVVLDQPLEYFFSHHHFSEFSHDRTHFRARESSNKEMQRQAGVRLKWTIELYCLLEKRLSLPHLNLPELNYPNDPAMINREMIEYAATAVRQHWNLDDEPLPNLVRLLERNGVVVGQVALDLPKLDGLSFWSHERNRPFILLNSDKASYVRSRFDTAHELGHMILHRNVAPELQRDMPALKRGTPIYKRMEEQAHQFASALLLPRDAWLRDVRGFSLAAFKSLKPKWQTSIQAMIRRASDLEQISLEQERSLNKQINSRKWRINEPFDDLWVVERPTLFVQAVNLLAKNGFGSQQLQSVFPRRINHLMELLGVSYEYFNSIDNVPMRLTTSAMN